jgi:hypothetical protein
MRKYPELFPIYYPFDDLSCWAGTQRGIIPSRFFDAHALAAQIEFEAPSLSMLEPKPGATYVIGADGAGYGVRDPAAAVVLEIWDNHWTDAFVYATPSTDPTSFARFLNDLGRKYNNALIVVENNGVGAGPITGLELLNYPNIFAEGIGKPGFNMNESSHKLLIDRVLDVLDTKVKLKCKEIVNQGMSYKADKLLEMTIRQELIANGRPQGNRRARHHWDIWISFMLALNGAHYVKQNVHPDLNRAKNDDTSPLVSPTTWDEWQAYRTANEKKAENNRRLRYSWKSGGRR